MNKQTVNPPPIEGEITFNGLGIAPKIFDVLLNLGFKTPTSIQRKAIPVAIEGKDIIGIAQTGTGKTLAFGIPLIQQILKTGKGKGLVIEKECAKILTLAGIKDIRSKTSGQTGTKVNLIMALFDALKNLSKIKIKPEDIKKLGIVEGSTHSERSA